MFLIYSNEPPSAESQLRLHATTPFVPKTWSGLKPRRLPYKNTACHHGVDIVKEADPTTEEKHIDAMWADAAEALAEYQQSEVTRLRNHWKISGRYSHKHPSPVSIEAA